MPAPQTNLQAIRNKFRRMTGRLQSTEITDAQIDEYINTFYLYDLPEHLRTIDLRVEYDFFTTPNVDTYDFPRNDYTDMHPPVYVAGYEAMLYQDRTSFYRAYTSLDFIQTITTGDGATTTFSGFLTNTPVLRGHNQNPPGAYFGSGTNPFGDPAITSTVLSTITPEVIFSSVDANNNPIIVGDTGIIFTTGASAGNGTLMTLPTNPAARAFIQPITTNFVNYATGEFSVVFPTAPQAGANINAEYFSYANSQPQSVLFFQNQFVLRPIPNATYKVSCEAYRLPTFLAAGEDPRLKEMWQLLAFGGALKCMADSGDMESYANYFPLYKEQENLILRRTLAQLTNQRSNTIYQQQTTNQQSNRYNQF